MTLPSLISFLDIPHIVDNITDRISFSDLHNCVFVSHAWHSALIVNLWRDVAAFRRVPLAAPEAETTYEHYFFTTESREALIKHAHYIRAITCRGNAILPVLVEAGVTRLRELNFIAEQTPDLDCTALVELIASNPRLHSLSVENIRFVHNIRRSQLEDFIVTLDEYPLITSFYMGGRFMLKGDDYKATLLAVLNRRLSRVDGSRVKVLDFIKPSQFIRSKRWWSDLTRVTVASQLPPQYYDNHQNGYPWNSVAVLDYNRSVQVCVPHSILDSAVASMLTRLPRLRRLTSPQLTVPATAFQVLPAECPKLRKLSLGGISDMSQTLASFLADPRVRLTSLRLLRIEKGVYEAAIQPCLPRSSSPHFLRHALVEAVFQHNILAMSSLLELLASCPNLHTLSAWTIADGSVPKESPVWASQLRLLSLGLYLEGNRGSNGHIDEQSLAISTAAALKLAPSFMHQLGQQTRLWRLTLMFSAGRYYCTSPFLELSVGCVHGLEQLARLSRLQELTITGLLHNVGPTEIAWMAQHWPRLRSIELPVINQDTLETAQAPEHESSLPDYTPWFPKLLVRIPRQARHLR
ncbi:hypothetical protein BGZ52_009280 [Haplosporangium bisporale]|nr:hypothetical protein BGZ52_009280 [Haplosporangium bisporale]